MSIIDSKPSGYYVCFERVDGNFLKGDTFPARDEPLIETEEEAWELARKFAQKTVDKCVNIYVVDSNFRPVKGYESKKITNRFPFIIHPCFFAESSKKELKPEFKAIEKAVCNAFSEVIAVTFAIQQTGDKTLIALNDAVEDAAKRIYEMKQEKEII